MLLSGLGFGFAAEGSSGPFVAEHKVVFLAGLFFLFQMCFFFLKFLGTGLWFFTRPAGSLRCAAVPGPFLLQVFDGQNMDF